MRSVGDVKLLARAVAGIELKDLQAASPTRARSRSAPASSPSSAVSEDGKAGIVVGVTADLTARFNAVDLVRKGAEALGGKGGGGRPDMAQAGGPDGSKADAALEGDRGGARRHERPRLAGMRGRACRSKSIESMAQVHFTVWLREVVPDGPLQADGGTVGDALGAVFASGRMCAATCSTTQGRLRKHVCIFADGTRLPQQAALGHAIGRRFHALCHAGAVRRLSRMSDRMLVATRKGLLSLERKNGGWRSRAPISPALPVTAALHDARDGALYAALKHGHFGSKLHRSDDGGESWKELPAPAFPADAAGAPALFQIWTLEAGGADATGHAVGRRAAGRPVPLRRPRRKLAAGQRAVGRAGAREMVRRRL